MRKAFDLHFISGLPRSGSTVLSAILRQNPQFTAGISSPVASMYRALETAMAQHNEGGTLVSDTQRADMLTGLFENFYRNATPTVFDTNRMWTTRLPAIAKLFPGAKIICCVRDLAWIMDSFERLHRRNPLEPSGIYGFDTGGTVYSRSSIIASSNGIVGFALNGLREACFGEQKDRLLLVEYEDLCKAPGLVLGRIYDFIGAAPFEHCFDWVEMESSEFDRKLGARGLHDVKGPVAWRERETILPPDIFARFADDQFWRAA